MFLDREVRRDAPGERHRLREPRGIDTRHSGDAFQKLAEVFRPFRPGIVTRRRKRNDHAERVLDLHAGIHARDVREAFPDETGANEEHERERDLTDDERAAQPRRRHAGGAFRPIAQRIDRIDFRRVQCREQSEERDRSAMPPRR